MKPPIPTPEPDVIQVHDDAYRGRHRLLRLPRLRHTLLGASLILPTTVTVAAVGVSGSGSGPMALASSSQNRQNGSPPMFDDSVLADSLATVTLPAEALVRSAPDRAARDGQRAALTASAAESERRSATEAALAATERVIEVSTVPDSGGGTEGAAAAAATVAAAPATPAAAPSAPKPSGKEWVKPLNAGYRLTSGYGARWGRMHPAQDLAAPIGTPVRALSSGTVLFAGWQGGYGNKLEIQFWDGTVAWYAHNSSLKVKAGQPVTPGQLVAASGNTGHSTGPHLHLEIHPGGGDAVPPQPWLAKHGIGL